MVEATELVIRQIYLQRPHTLTSTTTEGVIKELNGVYAAHKAESEQIGSETIFLGGRKEGSRTSTWHAWVSKGMVDGLTALVGRTENTDRPLILRLLLQEGVPLPPTESVHQFAATQGQFAALVQYEGGTRTVRQIIYIAPRQPLVLDRDKPAQEQKRRFGKR